MAGSVSQRPYADSGLWLAQCHRDLMLILVYGWLSVTDIMLILVYGWLSVRRRYADISECTISIVGSLRDREVACSASDRQGSNFESCVWRTVSPQSSHHPQEVLLAQFSLYVHKGGLKPDLFHFYPNARGAKRRVYLDLRLFRLFTINTIIFFDLKCTK